jgi:hypothetical protein
VIGQQIAKMALQRLRSICQGGMPRGHHDGLPVDQISIEDGRDGRSFWGPRGALARYELCKGALRFAAILCLCRNPLPGVIFPPSDILALSAHDEAVVWGVELGARHCRAS